MGYAYGPTPSPSSPTLSPQSTRYLPSLPPLPNTQDNGYSYLPQWTPSHDPTLHSNLTVKNDGRARYCQKCNYTKPDRTHHCSICKRCILKMDHHCPWLGNCIGFANYKAFVLFLVYLTVFCVVCCLVCGGSLWFWVTVVSPVWVLVVWIAVFSLVAISLDSFLGSLFAEYFVLGLPLCWMRFSIDCLRSH